MTTMATAPGPVIPRIEGARAAWLVRGWVGQSTAVKRLRADLARCVEQTAPILISGERGAGCAHAARQIFDFSAPGAAWRVVTPGDDGLARVTQTRGGLLLRDIEAFSLEEQEGLALCLSDQEMRPMRIFATSRLTHCQLQQEVFLHPTLARLFEAHMLEMPPLRLRIEDIPELCATWADTRLLSGRRLTLDSVAWLQSRSWPGNIRQLRHVIGSAARAASGTTIETNLLAESELATFAGYIRTAQSMEDLITRYVDVLVGDGYDVKDVHARIIAKVEKPMIQRVMESTNCNQLRAAQMLGLNRNTLRKKLRLLEISTGRS